MRTIISVDKNWRLAKTKFPNNVCRKRLQKVWHFSLFRQEFLVRRESQDWLDTGLRHPTKFAMYEVNIYLLYRELFTVFLRVSDREACPKIDKNSCLRFSQSWNWWWVIVRLISSSIVLIRCWSRMFMYWETEKG